MESHPSKSTSAAKAARPLIVENSFERDSSTGTVASWSGRIFGGLFGLLVLGFYFIPDQAGRNLVLYLTALSAHAFLIHSRAWSKCFVSGGGRTLLLLVSMPLLSLAWSTGASADELKRLLIAAYCVLAIYVGVSQLLEFRPSLATTLAILMLLAGNFAGAAAVAYWAVSTPPAGAFRLEGLWGLNNPVHASVLLLGGTLPVLYQTLRGERSWRWLFALVLPVCFVVVAGARAAAGAYLLVVVAMAGAWKPKAVAFVLLSTITLVGAALLLLGAGNIEEVWVARGLSYRDVVWQQVWSAYRECNFAVGCGLATPLSVNVGGIEGERAHSIFMATLFRQGALGLAVFIGGLGWLLWHGFRSDCTAVRGWACMLGYVLLANLTSGDHVLVRASLFWPSFWIPVMVIASSGRESLPRAST